MPITVEQKRASILVGGTLLLTLVLVVIAIVFLRGSDEETVVPKIELTNEEQAQLQEKTDQFITVTGNYGLKPDVVTADKYISYMANSSELALLSEENDIVKTQLATFNELTPDFFASNSGFLAKEGSYYSLYLIAELKTVRAKNISIVAPTEGFERDGAIHANVKATFDSTETIRVKTLEGPEWDGIVETKERSSSEEVTLTYRRENGQWLLLSVTGLNNDNSLSLLSEDVDSIRTDYQTVDTWDTGQRPVPDDHTTENTAP